MDSKISLLLFRRNHIGTATQELVGNVLANKFETFTDEMIENAKKRVIDVVGCAIRGAKTFSDTPIHS